MGERILLNRNLLGRALGCVALAVLLALATCPVGALATPQVDPARAGSVTVRVTYDGSALAGVSFEAWRVAAFDEDGQLELAGEFSGSGVDLSAPSKASEWDACAQELLAWARERGVSPTATGETDAAGVASFSGLEPGVYLFAGSAVTRGGYIYTPSAYLESVPNLAAEDAEYDVDSVCKVARTDAPVTPTAPAEGSSQGGDASGSWAARLGLVQTGDGSLTVRGVLALVATGAVLVLAGLLLWPRHARDKR